MKCSVRAQMRSRVLDGTWRALTQGAVEERGLVARMDGPSGAAPVRRWRDRSSRENA
jgi:hypothetical protein